MRHFALDLRGGALKLLHSDHPSLPRGEGSPEEFILEMLEENFNNEMELKPFEFHSHFFGPIVTELYDGADVAERFSCDADFSAMPDEEI